MADPARSSAWVRQVRRDWTSRAESWIRWEPQLLSSLSAVDPHLVRALQLEPGHHVLDFGCGSGEPALSLAPLVAPGRVVGVDLSAPMLKAARIRALLRHARNVRFVRGDIARMQLPGRFDRVVSRYGLMFVEDVPHALQRLHRVLKPGGRIAIAAWGPIERNRGNAVREAAMRPFLSAPAPDPQEVPGPFRLSRRGLLAKLLRRAGFRDVRTRGVHVPMVFAGIGDYFEYNFCAPGPMQDFYDSLSRRERQLLERRIARGLEPFVDGALLRLPAFAWVARGDR